MRMMKFVIVLVLISCLGESCSGNSSSSGVFNVRQFGANPDGTTDNSEAFSAAWKAACGWNGKIARLVIPHGTYLTGPVLFEGPCNKVSKMIVQVNGVVKASTDMGKFPADNWIVFQYLNGLIVTGGGLFDGQGKFAWPLNDCAKNAHCKTLPMSLRFNFVANSTVRRISLVDSKFFHMHVFECHNMNLHNIKITAPADSPNTDGIHIADSADISIARSVIGTGDDCISIGPGTSRIFISSVLCGPGHGISVGSLGKNPNEGDVRTVNVSNCIFSKTENGVRIKTWPGTQATNSLSNFTFENISMKDVNNPIVIDQRYCPHTSCTNKPPSTVKIRNVLFKDITGTSASRVAVNLVCSERYPCENVKLENINLRCSAKGTPAIASCSNVEGSSSGIQIPTSCI